jgi:hypothetical protein
LLTQSGLSIQRQHTQKPMAVGGGEKVHYHHTDNLCFLWSSNFQI